MLGGEAPQWGAGEHAELQSPLEIPDCGGPGTAHMEGTAHACLPLHFGIPDAEWSYHLQHSPHFSSLFLSFYIENTIWFLMLSVGEHVETWRLLRAAGEDAHLQNHFPFPTAQ